MKRPLSFACLIITLWALLSIALNPEGQFNNDLPCEGDTLKLCGEVSDIEIKHMEGYISTKIYLCDTDDFEGVLLVLKTSEEIPRIGQRIVVSGKVGYFTRATNDGQFDERIFYKTKGMDFKLKSAKILERSEDYSYIKDFFFRLRKDICEKIDAALPPDEASIMKTMLLGDKEDLDEEKRSLYQRNGIAHILAISGLHISLIGMGLFKFLHFLRLKTRLSSVLSITFVIFYGFLTGFSVSSVRATVMFSILIVANLLGRSYDLITALSLMGCITLVTEPLYIYHGGFGFSYGCVLGIGLLMPLLVEGKGIKRTVLSSLTMSVIGLPLYFWYYYQIPIYSLFLNFLIIPVMGILVPCGILLLIGMYVSFVPVSLFRIIIVGILTLFDKLALLADELPLHFFTPGRPKVWVLIVYIFVIGSIYIYKKKLRFSIRWGMAILASMALVLRSGDGAKITFLDVGQGDAILITCNDSLLYVPGFEKSLSVLVDCGSSDVKKAGKYRLMEYLKFHGISNLDMVVVTHPDEDHISGIRELLFEGKKEGIGVSKILMGDIYNKEESIILLAGEYYENAPEVLRLEVTDSGDKYILNETEVDFISLGDELITKDFPEFFLLCLNPVKGAVYSDTNESSVVLYGNSNGKSFLLTGDVCGEEENRVSSYIYSNLDKEISILKCAHHGSKNSTTDYFLDRVKAKYAIISVGVNNSYGHPHEDTLNRLAGHEVDILRTDVEGQIDIRLVERERN